MPPALFTFLSYPMTRLAHLLFPTAMANAVIAGAFVFCESDVICVHVRCSCCFRSVSRCRLRCYALRVSLRSLHSTVPVLTRCQQPSPHETPGVCQGNEEVPPGSPLQELRPWLRSHEQNLGLRVQHCPPRLESLTTHVPHVVDAPYFAVVPDCSYRYRIMALMTS